jgi:hypothetical protein
MDAARGESPAGGPEVYNTARDADRARGRAGVAHPQTLRGGLGHQGRRLERPAPGGYQPGARRDRLHESLQPHQRHRDRRSSGRVNGAPLVGAVRKGMQP